METRMKNHPPIYCPECSARLLNAGDRFIKNNTTVSTLGQENASYEYIIRCGKCGHYIGIKNSDTVK